MTAFKYNMHNGRSMKTFNIFQSNVFQVPFLSFPQSFPLGGRSIPGFAEKVWLPFRMPRVLCASKKVHTWCSGVTRRRKNTTSCNILSLSTSINHVQLLLRTGNNRLSLFQSQTCKYHLWKLARGTQKVTSPTSPASGEKPFEWKVHRCGSERLLGQTKPCLSTKECSRVV